MPVVIRVRGYHGTDADAAAAIVADKNSLQLSRQGWNWLGDGAYFFQDAPLRAWEWARFPPHLPARASPTVVGAVIRLEAPENCLDLLDIAWGDYLRGTYNALIGEWTRRGKTLPAQTPALHRLDRLVVNRAVARYEGFTGEKIRIVRAAFVEGAPIYPTSHIFDRTHVQIAVRDHAAIDEVWEEPSPPG